ncbi:hypothetical protein FBU30_003872 [Linnemannia zychae]|nr:hypothetical protein FBU30_003872 [Linnemannia zychae]
MDAVRNILRERQILESLDHCFMVNMRFAFQDDEYMYMCMDLMMGGDLRFHMNRRAFGEDVVRFWIAEISSAVNHLHSLGIVHRDIKPDNVLLDEKGHAHLTDFNIGCKLTPEKPVLTSQSGTVAYMAPEVFKGTGYGTSVDWWAVGIIFYECIYNRRPFQTENIPELRRAIANQTIEYPPQKGVSQDCIEVIQGFLTRDPNERLGTCGGMNGIRRQHFFQIEAYRSNMRPEQWWYLLETKQLTPAFQPPAEAANFDATYDLEEMLLEEDPLTYRSTRKRALRLHKEKMRAMREEEARQRVAQEAAEAAEAAAQAAMEAMNKQLEESIRKIRGMSMPPEPRPAPPSSSVSKKKSKPFFGSTSNTADSPSTAQPTVQIPSLASNSNSLTQVSLSSQQSHTGSQIARQTQFQSIPLSPIDPTAGGRELPLTPVPALRFPTSTAGDQYQPPPPPQNLNSLDHHPSSFYHRPSSPFSKPIVTTAATKPSNSGGFGNGYTHTSVGAGGLAGGASAPGVTAVYLPKSTLIPKFSRDGYTRDDHDPITGESGAIAPSPLAPPAAISRESSYEREAQLHQHSFQAAAQPQQAISSPVIIPTPLEHSTSRHKHIPAQQALPPLLRHRSSQQQLPPRRPTTPTPVNIEAAAAAVAAAVATANMTEEEKYNYQMDIIDREFTTFDYTIFESYHGLVDPVTMSVGDPPEWPFHMNNHPDTDDMVDSGEAGSSNPPRVSTSATSPIPIAATATTTITTSTSASNSNDNNVNTATPPTKRPEHQNMTTRATLTEGQKYDVCLYMKEEEEKSNHLTNKAVVQYIEYHYSVRVNESTVSRLRAQSATRLSKRVLNPGLKRHRAVLFPDLERRLGEFVQESQGRVVLTDMAILTRAKELAREMNIEQGKLAFSDGWLFKFKARHGVKSSNASTPTAAATGTIGGSESAGSGVGGASSLVSTSAPSTLTLNKVTGTTAKPPVVTPAAAPVAAPAAVVTSGPGASLPPTSEVAATVVTTAAAVTPGSAIPPQNPKRVTRNRNKRQRMDNSNIDVSEHGGEGSNVESLEIENISIGTPEIPDTTATAVEVVGPKTRRKSTRKGETDETALAGDATNNMTSPSRRKVSSAGIRSKESAMVSQDEQMLDMGGVDVNMSMDQDGMEEHELDVHPDRKSVATGSNNRGPSTEAIAHMEMLSNMYGSGPAVSVSPAEQQQLHQEHQNPDRQQRQQQTRQRTTRQSANEVMTSLTFNSLKSHKSAVPTHTTASAQPSLDGVGRAASIATSTTLPPSQSAALNGLGLSGTAPAIETTTADPVGSSQHPHHSLLSQHHVHQSPDLQPYSARHTATPATSASRAALSMSIADPIAASFHPEPSIDFAEAAQCVYTLRLFMQQQGFSRNQVDHLHAIYLTLDLKRKERLQQLQMVGDQQPRE